jgi:hypothetical protein
MTTALLDRLLTTATSSRPATTAGASRTAPDPRLESALRRCAALRRGLRASPPGARPLPQTGGQFWTPIRGQFWTPIDTVALSQSPLDQPENLRPCGVDIPCVDGERLTGQLAFLAHRKCQIVSICQCLAASVICSRRLFALECNSSFAPRRQGAEAGACKRRRENPSLKRPGSLVAPEQKCLGR